MSRFKFTVLGFLGFIVMLSASRVSVVQAADSDHVRWDITSQNFSTTPNTISPGGVAFATARNPNTLTIKLTGSGTFIGPASGGTSSSLRVRGLSSGLPVAGRLAVSPAAGLGRPLAVPL